MKNTNNFNSAHGFTLIELLSVLVMLGIVASLVLPQMFSGTAKANAQLKLRIADTLKSCIVAVHAPLGWGANVLSNANYESGNNALDMCVDGDVAIIAAQQGNFNRSNVSGLKDMVQIRTPATAGTSGEYYVGSSQVTLSGTQPAQSLSVDYANTPASEVCELKSQLEGFSGECDTSTADTTGVVQHDAESGGMNTMTIIRRMTL